MLISFRNYKTNEDIQSLDNLHMAYHRILQNEILSSDETKQLKSTLKEFHFHYALEKIDKAKILLNSIKDAEKGVNLSKFIEHPLQKLDEIITLAKNAHLDASDDLNDLRMKVIHDTLLELSRICKKVGTNFHANLKKVFMSIKYFKLSLEIYNQYFKDQYANEVIILYSNLIILQKNNFHFVQSLSKAALNILPQVTKDNAKYEAKIINQYLNTLFDKINKLSNSIDLKTIPSSVIDLVREAEMLISRYDNNSFVIANGKVNHAQKLSNIKLKLNFSSDTTVSDDISTRSKAFIERT